jgi:hypothetical protein
MINKLKMNVGFVNEGNPEKLIFKMLHISKKWIPINNYYNFIFFLLKVLGYIIDSHTFLRKSSNSESSDELFLTSYLQKLCYFKSFDDYSSFQYIDYNILVFIIYLVTVMPYVVFYIIFIKRKGNKHCLAFSYWEKLTLKLNGFIFSVSMFLFQHMVEILCFMYLNTYVNLTGSSDIPTNIKSNFLLFDNSLFLEKYLYCVLNAVAIGLLNLSIFLYFKLLNEPYFNSDCSFKFLHNNFFIILLIVSFNLQGFHYYFLAFIGTTQEIIKIFFIAACMITAILYMIVFSVSYNFNMFAFRLILVIYIEGLYTGIIDIMFESASNIVLTSMQYYLKIGLTLIGAFVSYFMIQRFKQNYYTRKISSCLFKKHKIVKSSVIYALVQLYKNAIEEKHFLVHFLQIINSHKFKCTSASCGCDKFKLEKFKNNMQKYLTIDVLNLNEKLTKFSQVYEDLLILCDFQISDSIHNKHKYDDPNDFSLFILYFDFVFYFKRNPMYANFLIEQYYRKLVRMPFFIRYYFFNYKKKIIKKSQGKLDEIRASFDINFESFIEYHRSLTLINRYVTKTCDDLASLVAFKSRKDSKLKSKLQVDDNNIDKIHAICRKLNKNYAKLIKFLKQYFTVKPLKNPELCYLLSQFFELVTKVPPLEVNNLFDKIPSYTRIDECSSFLDKGMNHPMIISIDEEDNYIVQFISQKLCESLDFKISEVMGQDFHIFLPKEFLMEHKVLMKKTVLLQNVNSFHKSTFMLTKNRYMLQVKLKVVFMPTLEQQILILIDVIPKIQLDKESTKSYKFVLDYKTHFISHTENFEENYELSVATMKRIDMDFQTLFNLDFQKYKNRIQKSLDKIASIDMENLDNMTKPYKFIELKDALKVRNDVKMSSNYRIKKFSDVESERILTFIKRKDKILKGLKRLKSAVEDLELDPILLTNILNFEKQMYKFSTINKLISLRSLADPKHKNNLISFFKIKISICSVGNLPYFYAKVYDYDKANLPVKLKSDIKMKPGNEKEIDLFALEKEKQMTVAQISRNDSNQVKKRSPLQRKNTVNIFKPKLVKQNSDNSEISNTEKNTQFINSSHSPSNLSQNMTSSNLNLTSSNNLLSTLNNSIRNVSRNMNVSMNMGKKNTSKPSNTHGSINVGDVRMNKLSMANVTSALSNEDNLNKLISTTWNNFLKFRSKKKTQTIKIHQIKVDPKYAKEFRSKNILEQILFFFMISFLIILLVLTLVNFYLKSAHIQVSKTYANLNFYSICTKASIFYSSALVIMGCSRIDGLDPPEYDNLQLSDSDLSKLFFEYSEDLMNDIYNFEYYLMKSSDQLEVANFIAQKDDYEILYQDWTSYLRKDTVITDELKMYHYYISSLQDLNTKMPMCRVKEHFIQKIKNGNISNHSEFTLFYIIENVFKGMRARFNNISFVADKLMTGYLSENELSATAFNVSILFIFILLDINLYLLFKNYCDKFDLIMDNFYNDHEGETQFISKLEMFRKILSDYDKDEVEIFERAKIPEEEKMEMIQEAANKLKRQMSRKTSFYAFSPAGGSLLDITRNSQNPLISVALPSNATTEVNPSSLSPLNFRRISSAVSQSSTVKNNHKRENTSGSLDEEGSEKSLKLDITLLKYGIYFLTFSIFVYISIVIANSLYNIREIEDLKFSGQVSINFIERFTRLCGMLIYFKLSLIQSNPDYITSNITEYDKQDYGNYFDIKQSFGDDSLFSILGNSEFAHYYHLIYLNSQNLHLFMNIDKYSYLLPNVRAYEQKIRTNSDFCYNLASGYINRAIFPNALEAYISMNQVLLRCKKFGSEIQQHGINIAMDLIVTSIKNMYLDYYQDKPYNYDSTMFHITQPKLVQIFNGVTVIFRELQKNFIHLIFQDVVTFYDSIINVEFTFSICLLTFNCIFIGVTFLIFIKKFRWYYNHLNNGIDKYIFAAHD